MHFKQGRELTILKRLLARLCNKKGTPSQITSEELMRLLELWRREDIRTLFIWSHRLELAFLGVPFEELDECEARLKRSLDW